MLVEELLEESGQSSPEHTLARALLSERNRTNRLQDMQSEFNTPRCDAVPRYALGQRGRFTGDDCGQDMTTGPERDGRGAAPKRAQPVGERSRALGEDKQRAAGLEPLDAGGDKPLGVDVWNPIGCPHHSPEEEVPP